VGASRGEEMNFIRPEISVWMVERRSSIFSIFVVTSPVSPMVSVMVPSWLMRRSRSFSCSFRTLMMKSRASRASFLVGFFAMCSSPFLCRYYKGVLGK